MFRHKKLFILCHHSLSVRAWEKVRLNSETEHHVEELLIGNCDDAIPILVLLTEELSQIL